MAMQNGAQMDAKPLAVVGRTFSSSGMDAFMEFEREMAAKRAVTHTNPVVRLERPVAPMEDECCGLDCPNCVLLVYQEQLLEYELSQRQRSAATKPAKPEPKYVITFLDAAETSADQLVQMHMNDNHLYTVKNNSLISQRHQTKDNYWRSVRHIDLTVGAHQHSQINDEASNIAVFVPNDTSVVDRVIAHLQVDPDFIFTVAPIDGDSDGISKPTTPVLYRYRPFETIGSVREALTWSLDILSTPRSSFLRQLAAYASDTNEIAELTAPNAAKAIQETRPGQRITVADIFDMFPSIHIDFASFYQFASLNAPRYYTVSSSRHLYPDTVSITLGLRQLDSQPTPRCSSYLSTLKPGHDTVRAAFFQSSFVFPREDRRPIMLVSAGTGIAPFRAFLQDLEHEQAASTAANHREAYLFYGCRHPEVDFLYGDDIHHAYQAGYLDGLFVEFSDAPQRQAKRYVQDAIAEQATMVATHLLVNDGYVFICGSLAMGRAVKHAIVAALREHSHLMAVQESADAVSTDAGAKAFLTSCLAQGRIVTELW